MKSRKLNESAAISETNNLYIQLGFKYEYFNIGPDDGAAVAIMLDKPKILDSLPTGATAGKFSKKLKASIFQEKIAAGYIHDCGNISRDKIEEALQIFGQHYDNFKEGLPVAEIGSIKPKENIIIANLIRALDNVSLEPCQRQPLSKAATFNNLDECISKLTC